jgi:hypothetical protein
MIQQKMSSKPPLQGLLPVVFLAFISAIGIFSFVVLKDYGLEAGHDTGKYAGTIPVFKHTEAFSTTLSPSQAAASVRGESSSSVSVKPAGEEKWVVVMNVNIGFYEFFRNWWAYYKCLNLDYEVYVIAEDDELEKVLLEAKLENVIVERNPLTNSSKALVFGTMEYSKMMFARPSYVLRHLKLGHNIITTDIDTGID